MASVPVRRQREREERGAWMGKQKVVNIFLITFAYAAAQTD